MLGYTESLLLLIKVGKAKIDLPKMSGATALILAAQAGHVDCLVILLD
jgi:ankyrin repeat protein